ncbi:MAG TPA: DNA polymerase domain-containing protein [Candidatus Bathyarchaeia archaeon]|nr:DNA polymerase domain-containing protein [Candidatus Bathyarchaeia archaeon]
MGDALIERVRAFIEELSTIYPIRLDVQEHYKAIFFTEKKKRYAGITEDGAIVVKGLEVRRGDWCALAKELQSDVIRIILEKRDPKAAAELVTNTIKRLRAAEIPLAKLVIYKTLTKKITSYESVQAHVRAAKRAKEYGLAADVGAKIGYLVMKGGGSIGDRSYPAEMFTEQQGKLVDTEGQEREIDVEYYVKNQILPPVGRILNYFDYKDSELEGQPLQSTLGHF